jgi:hypothetical protein
MKTSRSMQIVITNIAFKHGLDLAQPGGHLKLIMPNMLPLVIETLCGERVSVAHYGEQNGDAIRDPEVVFFCSSKWTEWFAVEITQDPVGKFRKVADNYPTGEWQVDVPAQADLTSFVRVWAKNIREQGWLERGKKEQDNGSLECA